ncbi:angiotensinogen isoform X1 [Nerophis ophidion]|uniref:angiotensinogen isoform X1 n=1 Tax=Nerophis ophidion TaxID=159077 RepID=UPI002ADF1F14|nr:angiotensinogen isoform X1 [Nerophis ophidion]
MQPGPLLLVLLCCCLSGGGANRVYIHPFHLFAADNVSCETLQNHTFKPLESVSVTPLDMAVLTPDQRGPSERDNGTQDVTQRTAVLAELLNSLGLRMYQALSGKQPAANTLFSPVNTYGSLVTFDMGASKKTARSFQDLLGLSSGTDREDCVSLVDGGMVLKTLHSINQQPQDHISAQAWLFTRPHVRLSQDVVQGAGDFSHSSFVRAVDFSQPGEHLQRVNTFVDKTSHGRVKEAFRDVDVKFNLLFLTSFHFQANFPSQKTSLQEFHVNHTTTVMTPMMTHVGLHRYFHDKVRGCTVIKLALSERSYMLVVLPDHDVNLHDIQAKLRTDVISSWKGNLHQGLLELSLPKLSMSSVNDVRHLLANMDPEVESRLLGSQAEFSQLANSDTFTLDKAINAVSLEMSEEEAVRRDKMEEEALQDKTEEEALQDKMEQDPLQVRINRPFFFSVMDADCDAMFLLGKISTPTL